MATNRGQHLIGTVLGSCVLERIIGHGGSSVVYLAQQHTPPRKVAVKVFLPRSTMDVQTRREFYRRFLREAEVASQLDHPNILPICSYGEQAGLPYIIMPYISGGTLAEYIAHHGPRSLQETLWHLEQIASALDYVHEHGCVHCDIKPANILLDGERRIVLADFGIARITEQSPLSLSGEKRYVTEVNALMGTPDYISPEQALGRPLNGQSDIYSLGVTLFFLLAGRLPFTADTSIVLALAHVHDAPPSLCLWRADISPLVDGVVHKALAKSPADRYQSARELRDAFSQAIMIPFESKSARKQGQIDDANVPSLESVLLISKPVVQVRQASELPVTPRSLRFVPSVPWRSRLVLIAATLLILLTGTSVAATMLISQRLKEHTTTRVAPPTGSLTNSVTSSKTDMLTDEGNWPKSGSFFYDNDQHYHVIDKSLASYIVALYNEHQFQNFRLTVTMTLVRSNNAEDNYYGVVFRSNVKQSQSYLFEVTNLSSGSFSFLRQDGSGNWIPIESGDAPELHLGVGKSNTIAIEAHGNNFTFFINDRQVGKTISDTSKSALTAGHIGLYVEQGVVEIAFSHLYLDELQ